ncbi:MAG: DUF4340 domain-containing protein [Acidobacteriota bacterium]
MRLGRLIALAVVVLGLGAYIYFYERHQPTTEERAERADKLLPDFQQDKATRIEITNSHGRFELTKEKNDWKLVKPITDDANSGAVTGLLSNLANLKAERTLAAKDVKRADYGLEKPQLVATVATEGGKTYTVKLGGELPLGNTRAAETSGDDVYIVSKWIASDLDRDLSGWRSTDLVRLLSPDIASLTVRGPEGRVALAHAGGTWTITEPFPDLADRDRAEGLVGDLNSAKIKEFVDTPGDLAALGLAPSKLDITIVRKEGAPLQLAFGDEREQNKVKELACKRGDRVFWVEANAVSHAETAPEGWRSKKLVALDTWNADRLEIDEGKVKVALERKDGLWKANGAEVDSGAVSRRLEDLADLEITSFGVPRPGGPELGKVTVKVESGSDVQATFYPGAAPTEAVASVPGRTGLMLVDGVKVRQLLADPAELAKPKPTPTPVPKSTPAEKPAATPSSKTTPEARK